MTGAMKFQIAIHVSGGHVNPSLTVAAMVCRKVSIPMGFVYIVAQFLGGIIGYGLVISVNPSHGTNLIQENGACVVSPSTRITIVQAFFTEFFASSVFVLLFCSQIDPRNESLASVAMKIGLTVFPLAYAAGAYSGVSLNPARAFGPAVWNNSWESHWVIHYG
ncbi:hypothetical protein RUM44_004700 [Polyplax serrata]|uniref:Uncharacterized protein n=1 Tax=Polyplax serrata TaxID=468196 RepID=A0ABR1B5E8_POLSC